jgi:hypothetical protein
MEVVVDHHQKEVQGNPCSKRAEDHLHDNLKEERKDQEIKKRNPWTKKLNMIKWIKNWHSLMQKMVVIRRSMQRDNKLS